MRDCCISYDEHDIDYHRMDKSGIRAGSALLPRVFFSVVNVPQETFFFRYVFVRVVCSGCRRDGIITARGCTANRFTSHAEMVS